MTVNGWVQILVFSVLLAASVRPLGSYMKIALEGGKTFLHPVLSPIENLMYQLFGIDPDEDQNWKDYAIAVLMFSLVSLLLTYAVLRLQGSLPLNPMHFSTPAAPAYATTITPDLAFNTSVSFTTNTNWQAYSGENTMSYLSQMLGLAFHNWVSAALGISVAIALTRGLARRNQNGIGNFWADLTRSTLYILLPLALFCALFLVWQGVVQNFDAYPVAKTLEGAKQIIPFGPIASQEAIKMLGTNGGGFLNANSAHPFENPTPLANLIEMLAIFVIPAGLTYTFGKMVNDAKQGLALLVTMYVLFFAGVFVCYHFGDRRQFQHCAAGSEHQHRRTWRFRGQYGGQRDAIWSGRLFTVCSRNDGRQLRSSKCNARFLYTVSRNDPSSQHRTG